MNAAEKAENSSGRSGGQFHVTMIEAWPGIQYTRSRNLRAVLGKEKPKGRHPGVWTALRGQPGQV